MATLHACSQKGHSICAAMEETNIKKSKKTNNGFVSRASKWCTKYSSTPKLVLVFNLFWGYEHGSAKSTSRIVSKRYIHFDVKIPTVFSVNKYKFLVKLKNQLIFLLYLLIRSCLEMKWYKITLLYIY